MKIKSNIVIAGGITAIAVVFFTAATFRHQNGEAPQVSVLAEQPIDVTDQNKEVVEAEEDPSSISVIEKSLDALIIKAETLSTTATQQSSGSGTSLKQRIQSADALLAKVGVVSRVDESLKTNMSPQQVRIAELQARLKALQ